MRTLPPHCSYAESVLLAFENLPSSSSVSGAALAVQPIVVAKDPEGQDVSLSGGVITVTADHGGVVSHGEAELLAGRAAFADLSLSGAIREFTLTFTAAVATNVISSTTATVLLTERTARRPTSALTRTSPTPPHKLDCVVL